MNPVNLSYCRLLNDDDTACECKVVPSVLVTPIGCFIVISPGKMTPIQMGRNFMYLISIISYLSTVT